MPSETHAMLYAQLKDVDCRVREVIDTLDNDALQHLLRMHRSIRERLQALGPPDDVNLLTLLTENRDQLLETSHRLKIRYDDLAGKLKIADVKRKLASAYGA
jgi:hypothetical protein